MAKQLIWLTIPALVFASIWIPMILQYHVPDAGISPSLIARAREEPPDPLLLSVHQDRLLYPGRGFDSHELVSAAESLLQGKFQMSHNPATRVDFPFNPRNLTLPFHQLEIAGLVDLDILLQAYHATREEKFLLGATESIVAFARYERRAWLPEGLLWNDHALANRVFVLTDFWYLYRRHRDFNQETARLVLESLSRAGELLARRQHFTFNTGHGVLQNIALLRLRLAFPSLPKAEYYSRLAIERLNDQMPYYINKEGVVLNHSTGYQFSGIFNLGSVFRDMRLLGLSIPEEWEQKYVKAVQFAAQLRRPDGSLPVIGDTKWHTKWWQSRPANLYRGLPDGLRTQDPGVAPAHSRPNKTVAWYPQAGYAVWWHGLNDWPQAKNLRQTIVAFSYFPGLAHKHADELSVVLWAGGHGWWSNLGYWPYGTSEREQAVSWDGANAPHLADEPHDSTRVPRMVSYASSARLTMVDVARDGPGIYRVRRQVVYFRPNVWLILDWTSGVPHAGSKTRWTTDHGVALEDVAPGRFILKASESSARLHATFFGSPGVAIRTRPKSLGPFNGASDRARASVSAIDVEQPAGQSWAATTWLFDGSGALTLPDQTPQMISWKGPEHWVVLIPAEASLLEISRAGERLIVRGSDANQPDIVSIRSDVDAQRDEIARALQHAAKKYERFNDSPHRRRSGSYLVLLMAGVQELGFLGVAWKARSLYARLRLVSAVAWIVGAVILAWLIT